MHTWGDSFDWNGFYTACSYLERLYNRATRTKPMLWKEKWGTLRFEYEGLFWLNTNSEVEMLDRCVRRTIKKYPQFMREIAAGMWGFEKEIEVFYAGARFAAECYQQYPTAWNRYNKAVAKLRIKNENT